MLGVWLCSLFCLEFARATLINSWLARRARQHQEQSTNDLGDRDVAQTRPGGLNPLLCHSSSGQNIANCQLLLSIGLSCPRVKLEQSPIGNWQSAIGNRQCFGCGGRTEPSLAALTVRCLTMATPQCKSGCREQESKLPVLAYETSETPCSIRGNWLRRRSRTRHHLVYGTSALGAVELHRKDGGLEGIQTLTEFARLYAVVTSPAQVKFRVLCSKFRVGVSSSGDPHAEVRLGTRNIGTRN